MELKDSTFIGVKFDGKSSESINNISKAILNITELFKAQNIKVDALLKIQDNKSSQVRKSRSKSK